MRLFVAINFNKETRGALCTLRDELRSHSARGNFSAPENLHLTLAFLGECNILQTDAVKTAMSAVTIAPLEIRIGRIGRFKRVGGDIWWAGIQDCRALTNLQCDLTNRLINAGFALDRRNYSPHITLGREVITDVVPWQIASFGETVDRFELMKSERIDGKLTYTSIFTVKGDA